MSAELTDLLDETVSKDGRISRSADTLANFNAAQILHRKVKSMLWWRWPSSKSEAIVSGMWNAASSDRSNSSIPLTTLMTAVPPSSAFAASLVADTPSLSPHKANVGTILHPRFLLVLQLRAMVPPPTLSPLPSALTTAKDSKIYTATDRPTPRPRAPRILILTLSLTLYITLYTILFYKIINGPSNNLPPSSPLDLARGLQTLQRPYRRSPLGSLGLSSPATQSLPSTWARSVTPLRTSTMWVRLCA